MANKTVTLAEIARDLKMDPKAARRKIRANASKAKPASVPACVKEPGAKNIRWEWDAKHRKAVENFLKA